MKNSIDTIGNRNRDLPACSAVPEPTAPPAACPDGSVRNRNFRLKAGFQLFPGSVWQVLLYYGDQVTKHGRGKWHTWSKRQRRESTCYILEDMKLEKSLETRSYMGI